MGTTRNGGAAPPDPMHGMGLRRQDSYEEAATYGYDSFPSSPPEPAPSEAAVLPPGGYAPLWGFARILWIGQWDHVDRHRSHPGGRMDRSRAVPRVFFRLC